MALAQWWCLLVVAACRGAAAFFTVGGGGGPASSRRLVRPERLGRGGRRLSSVASPPDSMEEQVGSSSSSRKRASSLIGGVSVEMDDETATMMRALRGENMDDSDSQTENVEMRVVEVRGGGSLPLRYDPSALARYFRERPVAVCERVAQIASTSFRYLSLVALDAARGRLKEAEVERAAELRRLLVSLGPFFIKLGQALSIRPDVLSPRAMVELQRLCDKVPSFDSELAFETIRSELKVDSIFDVFASITPEPVAAASLGQVYKATLRDSSSDAAEVAVKVQRPFVLETVSLDLYLTREFGMLLRRFLPAVTERLDVVALVDEFASRFFDELDYEIECSNGERMRADMAQLDVVIPRNYPDLTTRRVHVAEWVYGEKLSQSMADDVSDLVNLGVVTYLTQLLDTGLFHADPHPGNMLRTPDGKLVILDFGLVTEITDDQKYGMIEAIAHLIHRDYDKIGQDFVKLDFIPEGTDVEPIVPALTRVFDAALSGGGAKAINFNDLAADLAEITFNFPFRIPPYFALIIRAIGVLEGIALVADPDFAIVDEAWPYISKRLLSDPSPRMQQALRYTVYGKSGTFDIERMVDMLQALEKFAAVKALADDALSPDEMRRRRQQHQQQQQQQSDLTPSPSSSSSVLALPTAAAPNNNNNDAAREALRFFFSTDGAIFRDFVSEEVVRSLDAAARAIATDSRFAPARARLGTRVDQALARLAPPLDDADRKSLANVRSLAAFLFDAASSSSPSGTATLGGAPLVDLRRQRGSPDPGAFIRTLAVTDPAARQQLLSLAPLLSEHAPEIRAFAAKLAARLTEKQVGRTIDAVVDFLGLAAPATPLDAARGGASPRNLPPGPGPGGAPPSPLLRVHLALPDDCPVAWLSHMHASRTLSHAC